MIREENMSSKALHLVLKTIEEASYVMLKHKPKRKSMVVQGDKVQTEDDLFQMYAADYFDMAKYDKLKEKYRQINKDNIQADQDYKDAREYIDLIRANIYNWLKDAKEKERRETE